MKIVLKIISYTGLVLTLAPSILLFAGEMSPIMHKTLMFIGTLAWFATAPFWMNTPDV